MSDNKFVGFFYVEGDKTHGYIDQSLSYNETLGAPGENIDFMKILGKFQDPVSLSYQSTSQDAVTDITDQVMKFYVENTDGERNSIQPQVGTTLWPNFFKIMKFAYDYFYNNIDQKTKDTIISDIEAILTGSKQDSSGIINYSRDVYQEGSLSIVVMSNDQTKISYIKFNTRDPDSLQNRQFTAYVNPDSFVTDYTSDDPYIYVWYTPDRSLQLNDLNSILSEVQGEIAGKIINYYRKYDAITVIDGVRTTTAFHIWSKQFIPTTDSALLQTAIFREALQHAIRAEEMRLSEEELIIKYPEIFTSQQRILYCLSENKTIDSITVGGSFLLSNPVKFSYIENLLNTSDVLKPFIGDVVELFTIEANQIWLPIIAAGGLTDKIPFYRPTEAGINEFMNDAPEEVNYAKTFLRTLVRIINNAYDGRDVNSSTQGVIETGDPTITPPSDDNTRPYYIFTYKTVEWHVYCGQRTSQNNN